MIAPSDGQIYAQKMRMIYDQMEIEILSMISSRVSKGLMTGLDDDHWLTAKLAEVNKHQVMAHKIAERVAKEGEKAFKDVAIQSYLSGMLSADADLDSIGKSGSTPMKVGDVKSIRDEKDMRKAFGAIHSGAVSMLLGSSMEGVKGAHLKMVRQSRDAYRDVITDVSQKMITGVKTRDQIAQEALNKLADRGITKFVDKSGRNWDIGSYVEMATRTTTGQAVIQGHVNRMTDQGRDLVIVSDHPEESDLCRPHEGEVYSISGKDPKYKSLKWAIGKGLFHPNCRHRIYAYIEGLTEKPKSTEDPEGAKIRAKQRYIERQIRAWKKREAVAITPQAQAKARKKVKEWQGTMRDFVAVHDRRRDYKRERLSPIGGGTAPTGPKFSGKKSTLEITRDADKERTREALKSTGAADTGKAISSLKEVSRKDKEKVIDATRDLKESTVVVPKPEIKPKPEVETPKTVDIPVDSPIGWGSGIEPYEIPVKNTRKSNVRDYTQSKFGYTPADYWDMQENGSADRIKNWEKKREATEKKWKKILAKSNSLTKQLDAIPEYHLAKNGKGGYDMNKLMPLILPDVKKVLLEKSSPTMNAPTKVFGAILDSGKFKSQFETGTSGGALAFDLRRYVEEEVVGIPTKLKNEFRPVYGFLDDHDGNSKMAWWYGEIKFRIKKEAMKEKATLTWQDSLDYRNPAIPLADFDDDDLLSSAMPPEAIIGAVTTLKNGGDPRISEMTKWNIDGKSDNVGYPELQFHGGVDLGDIDSIDIELRSMSDRNVRRKLIKIMEAGVKVRVYRFNPSQTQLNDFGDLYFENGKYKSKEFNLEWGLVE